MTHDPATGETGPRWTDERTILRELETLNDLSMAEARRYYQAAREAADAEATHKALRAKRILLAQANGTKAISAAEAVAEADETVAQAYLQRLLLTATAEAIRESLRTIRNNQDGLRTAIASHRDMLSGPGMGGSR